MLMTFSWNSIGARILALLFLLSPSARAAVTQPLPPSLAYEALSETMPTAMPPTEYTAEDFSLEWDGPSVPGMDVRLEARSLEWVRVQDVLVLPRARAAFGIAHGTRGKVGQAKFSQPLIRDSEG